MIFRLDQMPDHADSQKKLALKVNKVLKESLQGD